MEDYQKLAIEGGEPVRTSYLNYGRQCIDDDDIRAVVEVLKSDLITCGPKVLKLEERLCSITGARYAVAVSSGTAALHVACMAAGLSAGDEVIVPAITFAASANCVLYCGGTPVFADIDRETWNIDPVHAESLVTPKTKAIVAVDYMGIPADYKSLHDICKRFKLLLIEDAAHSLGSRYAGRMVGSIADMTTFSFHPVKTVTAGEGGAVLTDDPLLYERAYQSRVHGITRDIAKLQQKDVGDWYYEQQFLGYNYRLTDIHGALCLSQLDKLEAFSLHRKRIIALYNRAFSDMDEIILPKEDSLCDTTRHIYVIRLNLDRLKCTRKEIFDALRAENIGVNVHYIPVYWLPYYKQLGYQKGICPNAEALYESIITLPLHCRMTDGDARDVVKAVRKVINYYRR